MKSPRLLAALFFVVILGAILYYVIGHIQEPATTDSKGVDGIRVLAWVGYDEPDFVSLMEQRTGLKIQVKPYVGGDQMYNLYTSATPGTYDLIVVDVEYGKKLFEEAKIIEIKSDQITSVGYHDFFQNFPEANGRTPGSKFAVVVRWGALGIVYNTAHVSRDDIRSYKVLWNSKYKGQVGLFDWYLPNMGVISKALGHASAYNLNNDEFKNLATYTKNLGSQAARIQPNTSEVIADLSTGAVWLVPGIGEWACAQLIVNGQPIDWMVPDEGGIMWIEGLAIAADISETRQRAALKFIQEMASPEVQAKLAWRRAYQSQVPNVMAYALMNSAQRKALKVSSSDEIDEIIKNLSVRDLPKQQSENEWQQAWDALKASILRK